jgi:hypothetical protein
MIIQRYVLLVGLLACAIVAPAGMASPAAVERSFCIFDPVGANGFVYHEMRAYVAAALHWGVKLDPRPYTDEGIAAADFKAGKCDAVGFTGIRNMKFVRFAGSLDMAGGLRTYREEATAIKIISTPQAAKYMRQGNYEVAGVAPGGKIFLFAQTKSDLAGLQQAAGKKVAVLSYDKQASAITRLVGASPIPASIASLGPKFNNGSVDYVYAPAYAYQALELYKGLGKKGGVADFSLAMMSLQMDIHWKRFPKGFGQKSRTWAVRNLLPRALRLVKKYDQEIPDHYWVHISGARAKKYRRLLVQARQRLWDDHWYNHKMQHLLKKIRCHYHPSLGECSESTEGGPA